MYLQLIFTQKQVLIQTLWSLKCNTRDGSVPDMVILGHWGSEVYNRRLQPAKQRLYMACSICSIGSQRSLVEAILGSQSHSSHGITCWGSHSDTVHYRVWGVFNLYVLSLLQAIHQTGTHLSNCSEIENLSMAWRGLVPLLRACFHLSWA